MLFVIFVLYVVKIRNYSFFEKIITCGLNSDEKSVELRVDQR